jgi:phage tail tape-measure protein
MGIDKLPKPGANFSLTNRSDSFARKLNSAVRYGEDRNLQDNVSAIESVLKSYQRQIRQGGLDRLQIREAWYAIKKKSANLTKEDERDIKKILEGLRKK